MKELHYFASAPIMSGQIVTSMSIVTHLVVCH
jgi:hypothetical protein